MKLLDGAPVWLIWTAFVLAGLASLYVIIRGGLHLLGGMLGGVS